MMHKMKYKTVLASLILAAVVFGCSKKWDNHDQATDSNVTINLYQAISKTANTTIFAGYLQKAGYDKLLAGSKTYTVWVPTDAALASMDPSVVADSAKLSQFVLNHISNQSYPTGGADQRIPMLNGKYILQSGLKFDSANIVTPNQYAKNGLFHIIDKFIPRTNNIWEFLNATTAAPQMKNYLLSLNYIFFDSTKATQTGVDPLTGNPTYQSGTGLVQKNVFLNGVGTTPAIMNVSDETNQYTFFVLNDNSFTTELNKLTPWFKTGTTDSTTKIASAYLVKDLAFQGSYAPSALPDTLTSQYGVKVPINKSAIVSATKTSNGWVYVMNQVNFNLNYKFPSIIIQGENPSGFSSYTSDFIGKTFYRVHQNPNTGATFNDIFIINAGLSSFYVRYTTPYLPTMRYNVYWVAVNDYQTVPWQQKLAVDSSTNPTLFAYKTLDSLGKKTLVPPRTDSTYKTYYEVSHGQFAVTNYRPVNLFAVSSATASTSSGGQLSLDYIRLEPAF